LHEILINIEKQKENEDETKGTKSGNIILILVT